MILVTFLLLIGDYKTLSSGKKVNFIFHFVNGVKVGAPIRFSGVDIGEIRKIRLDFSSVDNPMQVKIEGIVKKEVNIPLDSEVWVNTLGLLGEKYIEIIPGKDYSRCLAEGDAIRGNDPMGMQEITNMAKKLIDNVDESITKMKNKEGTVGRLLYDEELYANFENIVKNIEEFSLDIRRNPWKLFIKTKEKKPEPSAN